MMPGCIIVSTRRKRSMNKRHMLSLINLSRLITKKFFCHMRGRRVLVLRVC